MEVFDSDYIINRRQILNHSSISLIADDFNISPNDIIVPGVDVAIIKTKVITITTYEKTRSTCKIVKSLIEFMSTSNTPNKCQS